MKLLSSNRDLYEYLLSLSSELKKRGSEKLSNAVIVASRQAAATSTEFLGESRIALRQVLKEENGILTEQDHQELLHVLAQLDDAFAGR